MPRKATTKETIKKNTIEDMKKLGVYKPEYDRVIDVYSELCEQYEFYIRQLKGKKLKCDEDTAAGGTKKSALISTIETLRKDILAYSDRLCLNPKSLGTITSENTKKKSKLASALSSLQ
ncbi:P27 family phage terminase small subunit [Clostridium neonatale]|uniref:P27 family phage terminase small subunit n=1 Tax=Clostridium neonatale TaxID=137838 RepID=UPI00291C152F|nr:P27 family phage terminase small subunit [Clostridium neonatale]CAI3193141.1 Terminase [Clostridium neonatale]CAI3196922.1 Terminase [Clostridium neonatale]